MDLKSIKNNESLALVREMQTICNPLKSKDIVYFSQVRIYNNGSFVVLANGGKWLEHFFDLFNQGKYIILNYSNITLNKDMDYFIVDNNIIKNQAVPDIQTRNAKEIFHYGHVISIAYRSEQYTDIYDFVGPIEKPQILNFFVNNLSYLITFIENFKTKGNALLNKIVDNRHSKNKSVLPSSKNPFAETLMGMDKIAKNLTLKEGNRDFTNRETDVFKLLLMGRTAKQIAKALNISPRTAEQYTNQIKLKLGCSYKNEIIPYAFEQFAHEMFAKIQR